MPSSPNQPEVLTRVAHIDCRSRLCGSLKATHNLNAPLGAAARLSSRLIVPLAHR